MKAAAAACVLGALLTAGCATSLKLEAEHVSHPGDGWPFEKQKWSEDGLTQASMLLHWHRGQAYLDAGIGYNLQGNNGGGFYGSPVTGTVRLGYEVPLR